VIGSADRGAHFNRLRADVAKTLKRLTPTAPTLESARRRRNVYTFRRRLNVDRPPPTAATCMIVLRRRRNVDRLRRRRTLIVSAYAQRYRLRRTSCNVDRSAEVNLSIGKGPAQYGEGPGLPGNMKFRDKRRPKPNLAESRHAASVASGCLRCDSSVSAPRGHESRCAACARRCRALAGRSKRVTRPPRSIRSIPGVPRCVPWEICTLDLVVPTLPGLGSYPVARMPRVRVPLTSNDATALKGPSMYVGCPCSRAGCEQLWPGSPLSWPVQKDKR